MTENPKNFNTLVLVDGSSYLYRAFHALPPLVNSKGEPTGAVMGVLNMLRKLIADYNTSHIAIVFDAKGKTFRDDLFAEYKSHRPPMPDDLRSQIEPLHTIIKAMGLPLLCVPGVEADDVIGTLATNAYNNGIDTIISTGDKDMAQLVNDRTLLVNTMTGSHLNPEGVLSKFGVRADQIIEYLALAGDTADNIPGVPGVGPKTASKWLNQYDTLENLIAHKEEIKGKIGEKLRANLDNLALSRELTTIRCNLELEMPLESLVQQAPDKSILSALYQRLEFKRLLSELNHDAPAEATATAAHDYQLILTPDHFNEWLERLKKSDYFAFDTETTSLNYLDAELVGLSFAITPHQAAYVPFVHSYEGAPTQLDRTTILSELQPLLEASTPLKIGQNIKYDSHILANYGIALKGIGFDTMLESYALNSTASRHDMDSLALKYLGHQTIHFEDVAGKGAQQKTFDQIDLSLAAPYAAEDADITLRLHQTLWPKLKQLTDQKRIYEDIEHPLIPVLAAIERNGVLIDTTLLKQQSEELNQRIITVTQQAVDEAGEEFNLSSPKQIQYLLYEKLGCPVTQKTPKGQPSTSESVLSTLAADYPLPKLILEYRSLSKLKSTYTDKLPTQINASTGRIHTSYHQAVAITGRLSSSDPNLQNIPIKTAEGRRIRQAFIAPDGCKIVAADYSQIELRIMAHLSSDEGLLNAFRNRQDIHSATASEIFNTPLDQVTTAQRRSAKVINFGLIYGMSVFGLARQLGVDRFAAKEYMDTYFQRYPGVQQYMDEKRAQAKAEGYVETLFGRRLYLPDIHSRNGQRRQYAERAAINAPMQGTAADIIKKAMIITHQKICSSPLGITMIMQVHDELVFEVQEAHLDEAIQLVETSMCNAAELAVPLTVDTGIGSNWDEAH